MTYLELCKRLRQESSVSGDGPASTFNQVGEMQRMCNWINTAYEEIQNMFTNWQFLTLDFSFDTEQGKQIYPVMANFAKWKPDSFRIQAKELGRVNEQWLRYMDYERHFRDSRGFSATALQTGRPIDFSIMPDKSLIFFPIPNETIYTIKGQYYRANHRLELDIDEPLIPERFQMAIVWKALQYYANYESAAELLYQAKEQYAQVCGRLQIDQLPTVALR